MIQIRKLACQEIKKKLDRITIRQSRQIPHHRLQTFAQQLDLGDVYNIPDYV